MKNYLLSFLLFITVSTLFSAIIITRNENGVISKELYQQNIYAEIHFERIVALFDFNRQEITNIDHQLQIYTTIDFDRFRTETEKQNRAQIDTELQTMDPERRQMMAMATNGLFRQMRPGFMLVDTLDVCGYKAYEYHIYNGETICQKLWISKEIQEKINTEVNPVNILHLEQVLKNNREKYLEAMGIDLDPISQVVESIETVGYVVKRIDYGLRDQPDPEYEREMDAHPNAIVDVVEMTVDPSVLTFHQKYRRLSYSDYMAAVIRMYGE